MASQRPIDINPNPDGDSPRVVFDPDPLQAKVRKQIFWINHDSEPHWPGLLKDGEIDEAYFMPNQIAPNSPSSGFGFMKTGTYDYACSLHPDEKGSIEVS